MATRLVHLNGNLMAAVDVETTGLDAGIHDLVQVCVLPLDSHFMPLETLNEKPLAPFCQYIQPKRPENADAKAMKANKLSIDWLLNNGIEPYRAADLFEEWWESLNLGFKKKLCPLGANTPFDRGFMIEWLGPESYYQFFDYHSRDIQSVANYLNDRADHHNQKPPFPFVSVSSLATKLSIPHEHAHDAMQDCLIEAAIYRKMLGMGL